MLTYFFPRNSGFLRQIAYFVRFKSANSLQFLKMSDKVEKDIAAVWGNFLHTPEAKVIIQNAATPSKDVIDKLLLAALAYTRGGQGGASGFHQWGDRTFPSPPPTAFIPQCGVRSRNVNLGILNPQSPTSGIAVMNIGNPVVNPVANHVGNPVVNPVVNLGAPVSISPLTSALQLQA
jgi:hypothetical protein